MSTRVYASDQNPLVDHFAYRCSDSSAEQALASDRAFEVVDGDGRTGIQLRESAAAAFFVRERALGFRVSANTVLAFLKTDTTGDKLHYETPMAGDVGIRRHDLRRTSEGRKSVLRRRVISVSHRSLFSKQAIA